MNKSRRRFFSVLAIAVVALFALACVVGFAACGDDDNTKSDATVSSVTLDKSELGLTVGGDVGSLTATVTMSDGGSYGGGYSWSSSNSSVATVSLSGNPATVTAVAAGTATITVTVNNSKTATCTVTVTASSSSGGTTGGGTTGGNQGTTEGTEVTGTSTIRAEAECAEIDVDESALYYWLNNEVDQGEFISGMGFLFNVQKDETASGGSKLGYLAHDNPTATFKITSDVVTSATLTLHAASCDVEPVEDAGTTMGGSAIYGLMLASINDYKGEDHDILTVNGSSVTLSGTLNGNNSVFATGGGLAMNNWGDLTATINLVAGVNTIVLTHDGAGVSWDYIEITTTETATFSFTAKDNSNLVGYDSKWEPVGEAEFKAEDATLTDATGSSAQMSTESSGAVSNITNGDTLTFNVTVSAETGEAAIYAYVSSSGTLAANDITISVDDTQISSLTLQSGMIWGTVDKLVAGDHTIVITCASSSTLSMTKLAMDWDYASDGGGHYTASTIELAVSSES